MESSGCQGLGGGIGVEKEVVVNVVIKGQHRGF